jgi:hypothetical protein
VLAISHVPLLPVESESDYRLLAESDYRLLAERIVDAARPNDAIEELLIRDVIDLTWEVLRLRRTKAGVVRASFGASLQNVLRGLFGESSDLVTKSLSRNKAAEKEVAAKLAAARLTIEDVEAQTVEFNLDVFERLDRMMASAGARRNNALREIDRHREALGASTRKALEEIEDVPFTEVGSGTV